MGRAVISHDYSTVAPSVLCRMPRSVCLDWHKASTGQSMHPTYQPAPQARASNRRFSSPVISDGLGSAPPRDVAESRVASRGDGGREQMRLGVLDRSLLLLRR